MKKTETEKLEELKSISLQEACEMKDKVNAQKMSVHELRLREIYSDLVDSYDKSSIDTYYKPTFEYCIKLVKQQFEEEVK